MFLGAAPDGLIREIQERDGQLAHCGYAAIVSRMR
jgi:hypothetical protein